VTWEIESYVRFEAAQVDARAAGWLTPELLAANLRDDLGAELALRSDGAQAELYRQRCPVAGADAREYLLRELDLGRDGRVLAGIHFLAMDVRRPFVGVLARTQAFEDGEAVARMGRQLQRAFARFAPECWRIWASPDDATVDAIQGARIDMRVVAGKLDELCALPAPRAPLPVALELCSAVEIYGEYQATFERFFAAHPEWRGRIQVETQERMHEAETRGVLARATVASQTAGFFAVVPAVERTLRGYVVLEEILDAPFRGKRLAAPLQRMLIERVAERGAPPDTIVFGHIALDNHASLHTALRVGRSTVYRTLFMPFT
jgi:hypothetical protein